MRDKILKAGLKLWRKDPASVSAREIGRMVGLSHSGVLYYFNGDLKDQIASYAIATQDVKVIAQLILMNHPAVSKLSKIERFDYIQKLS